MVRFFRRGLRELDDAPILCVCPVQDERCNSLSFSDNGTFLVSSHNDGVLQLFSGDTGSKVGEYHCKDSGCRLVAFTHHESGVLHAAGRPGSDPEASGMISYHSLHDNKIVRYFRGHTDFVTSISQNPQNDTFVSSSKNGQFKIWDLRSPNCVVRAFFLVAAWLSATFLCSNVKDKR